MMPPSTLIFNPDEVHSRWERSRASTEGYAWRRASDRGYDIPVCAVSRGPRTRLLARQQKQGSQASQSGRFSNVGARVVDGFIFHTRGLVLAPWPSQYQESKWIFACDWLSSKISLHRTRPDPPANIRQRIVATVWLATTSGIHGEASETYTVDTPVNGHNRTNNTRRLGGSIWLPCIFPCLSVIAANSSRNLRKAHHLVPRFTRSISIW